MQRPRPQRLTRVGIEAVAGSGREADLDPGFDEPLVVDIAGNASEEALEFSVGGHRLDQDEGEAGEVGRLGSPGLDFRNGFDISFVVVS
jgi:hypothetical protein